MQSSTPLALDADLVQHKPYYHILLH